MKLWERLVQRRIELGLAAKEAAYRIGVSEQFIGQIEKNKKKPAIDTLARICIAYECTADWLLGLPDAPEPNQTLSVDERSIIGIMGKLSEHRKEEVIRLAEVVLEMHQKEDEVSLFDRLGKKTDEDDDTPHVFGEDPHDPQDNE